MKLTLTDDDNVVLDELEITDSDWEQARENPGAAQWVLMQLRAGYTSSRYTVEVDDGIIGGTEYADRQEADQVARREHAQLIRNRYNGLTFADSEQVADYRIPYGTELAARALNWLYDEDIRHRGHIATWNRSLFGLT